MKTKLHKILTHIDELQDESERIDQACKDLFSIINPANHPPFIELTRIEAYIDGISVNLPISEDLGYYAWELRSMDDEEVMCVFNGKEYNAKNKEEFVQFIIDSNKL